MHSPSTLAEHMSLNLARLFLLDPVEEFRVFLKPVVHHQYLLLEIMFISMFTFTLWQPGRRGQYGHLEVGTWWCTDRFTLRVV